MMEHTSRQVTLLTMLRSCIAEVGEMCGEASDVHLNLRDFQNQLDWYLANRVQEIRHDRK